MFKRLFAIISVAACISGAAQAANAPNLKKYSGADAGHLLLSASGPGGARTTIRVRRLDGPGKAVFDFKESTLKKAHFIEEPSLEPAPEIPEGISRIPEKARGFVYDIPLPEGKYEIDEVRTEMVGYPLTLYFAGTIENGYQAIPFEIQRNKSTYIGRLYAFKVLGKGIFGIEMEKGAMVLIRDKMADDLAIVPQYFPEVAGLLDTAIRSVPAPTPAQP